MEQASATLTQLLQRMQQQSAMAFTSDPKAARQELERRKAECYNREEGTLNQQDNYNCPPCGIIWRHCRPGRVRELPCGYRVRSVTRNLWFLSCIEPGGLGHQRIGTISVRH